MHPFEVFHLRTWRALFGLVSLPLLLSACVSVPDPIATEPSAPVAIKDVQTNIDAYSGKEVRWGGTIVGIVNNSESSDLLIVSRPLSRLQRPKASDTSSGRFIARVPGFLEPETYTEGREVTVTGAISGIEIRPVGQTQYTYPVVAVEGKHLWSKRPTGNRAYTGYHGFHHYHHPAYWWENDHYHHGRNGVYGRLFYHGRI